VGCHIVEMRGTLVIALGILKYFGLANFEKHEMLDCGENSRQVIRMV
jgi:hypothetical protein